jgi:hypothetical protein
MRPPIQNNSLKCKICGKQVKAIVREPVRDYDAEYESLLHIQIMKPGPTIHVCVNNHKVMIQKEEF